MPGLEKIVSSFLSLPGLFFLLSLIISIYLLKKASSITIKIISVITLILMYLLFTGIGTAILVIPLEKIFVESGIQEGFQEPCPIIVLGGGIKYTEKGAFLSPYSLQRLVKGFEIYKEVEMPVLFTGGVAIGQSETSESQIAADWLKKMGVRPEDIVIENQARTTYENGVYSRRWLEKYYSQQGVDGEQRLGLKAYLVTNSLHMLRSVLVFQKQGVELIPVSSGIMVNHRNGWLDYLPNRGALSANMMAVHEWMGLVWYKITGRI